jgi:hypothetical protein
LNSCEVVKLAHKHMFWILKSRFEQAIITADESLI